jgi:hypothetical protein
MSTNYPSALDTAVELGSTFTNVIAVTDPVTQIDAAYRVNTKDAIMALEARVGTTNSAITTSLSWATISVGGVDNLGLRFAGNSATWPGLVAETGIFLDSATGFPNFHYAGDAVGTFYPLTAVGLIVSLQNAYNTSGAITTSGADDIAFNITAGDDFVVTHAAGTHTVISGASSALATGLLDINFTSIAASNVVAVHTNATNSVNNQLFGAYIADIDNTGDLAAGEIVYGFASDLDMSGDGPLVGRAVGAGFYAKAAAFTGANNYESAGLYVESAYTYGVLSESTLRVEVPISTAAIQVDSDPTAAAAAVTIADVGTAPTSGYISCVEGTLDSVTAVRFFIQLDGATAITANSASDGLTLNQAGAGYFLTCVDSGGPTNRLRCSKNGNLFLWADAGSTTAVLVLDHGAATEPFVDFDGTYAALAANGNITDEDAGGAVVGPGTNTWVFAGMCRQEVSSGGGGIPAGDYWTPLYTHV